MFLFKLIVGLTNSNHGNKKLVIEAFEGEPTYTSNHTRIDMVATLFYNDGNKRRSTVIFEKGELYCGIPGHNTIDGKAAKSLVLNTVGMKLGDTDSDYFDSYSMQQLDFANEFGETIRSAAYDRYGNL